MQIIYKIRSLGWVNLPPREFSIKVQTVEIRVARRIIESKSNASSICGIGSKCGAFRLDKTIRVPTLKKRGISKRLVVIRGTQAENKSHVPRVTRVGASANQPGFAEIARVSYVPAALNFDEKNLGLELDFSRSTDNPTFGFVFSHSRCIFLVISRSLFQLSPPFFHI